MVEDELPEPMRAAYAALQQQFRAGLAQRWQQIRHPASPAQQLLSLHQLAGGAGSYGYAELSQAARQAEQAAQAPNQPEALEAALQTLASHLTPLLSVDTLHS